MWPGARYNPGEKGKGGGKDPYGYDKGGYGKDSYGKDSWGKDGYGKDSWGKDSCGKDSWGKDGYGKDSWGKHASFQAFSDSGFGSEGIKNGRSQEFQPPGQESQRISLSIALRWTSRRASAPRQGRRVRQGRLGQGPGPELGQGASGGPVRRVPPPSGTRDRERATSAAGEQVGKAQR